jgi:hypothetical protein
VIALRYCQSASRSSGTKLLLCVAMIQRTSWSALAIEVVRFPGAPTKRLRRELAATPRS